MYMEIHMIYDIETFRNEKMNSLVANILHILQLDSYIYITLVLDDCVYGQKKTLSLWKELEFFHGL